MNKLLVSDIIDINNGEYILESQNKKVNVNINGEVKIYLIKSDLEEININLKEGSKLNFYKFDDLIKNDILVNIYQKNNSKIFYNASYLSNKNCKLTINNYIIGNNNESNIKIRNISNKDNSEIIINMEIKANTINNIALEDLKGINNGGFIHIEPNIICSSNEIMANHLTTIGGLDKNSLNYLMSKGLSSSIATKLLLNGFKFSNMDNYIIKNFGGDEIE